MLQPLVADRPTLVAKRPGPIGPVLPIGDHHAALSGCQLFVGVKSEDPGIPEGTGGLPVVVCSKRLG